MPSEPANESPSQARTAPEVVAPTNRINVALPFSRIQTAEPSKELGELAEIVAELAAIVQRLAPEEHGKRLHEQAQRLAAQLR
jgi:hypothetical protein